VDAERSHRHISFIIKWAGGFGEFKKWGNRWKAGAVMFTGKATGTWVIDD
jgi:hypothetical protein